MKKWLLQISKCKKIQLSDVGWLDRDVLVVDNIYPGTVPQILQILGCFPSSVASGLIMVQDDLSQVPLDTILEFQFIKSDERHG
jgi:hypothetical protein